MNKTKTCSKCKLDKPIEEFAISKKGDGRDYWCKACHKVYRQENIERIREKDRKYHIDNAPRLKIYYKKYCEEHKEIIAEKKRAYHQRNLERDNAWKREWHNKNRPELLEKKREYNAKNHVHRSNYLEENHRRTWAIRTRSMHRQKGMTVEIELDDLHDLAEKTNHCSICGRELVWKSGHKKSIRSSPTPDRINNEKLMRIDNVWIVCHRCNTCKGELAMKEYIEHCKMVVSKFGNMGPEMEVKT